MVSLGLHKLNDCTAGTAARLASRAPREDWEIMVSVMVGEREILNTGHVCNAVA